MARAFWVLALSLASTLTACGARPCPTLRHTDPLRALEQHRSMRVQVESLRGEARVEQWGEQGRIAGTVFLFVRRPDRVRFDAMTQFGPAAVLTSDGQRFQLFDLRENRFLEGPTCPSNIARLVGVPFSSEELALFLLGDSPRLAAASESIACGGNGNYVITRTDAAGMRQEIELSVRDADRALPPAQQHTRLVRSELFRPDGTSEWRATFEDHRFVPDPRSSEQPQRGVALPHRIHFVGRGADTLVRFKEITLNPEVPAEAFTQQAPPGITRELVRCP